MNSAEEIIEYFSIDDPSEIDIEAICYHFNAEVEYRPLTGCEGRLIGFQEKAIITVNENSSTRKQRFTMAHELCHWLNDKGKVSNHICTDDIISNKWTGFDIETRANNFAASLLMPKELFNRLGRGKKFRLSTIREISEEFDTSITATAIRFLNLELNNGLIVSSVDNRRRWFSRNKGLPEKVWPVDLIDNESFAKYLESKNIGDRMGGEVPADLWINRSDASFYNLYEDSIKTSENSILSLISWDDESYLIKLSD